MIKFAAVIKPKGGGGEPEMMLGIILSYDNLDALRNGRPILFDFAEVNVGMPEGAPGFPAGKVMVAADETEEKVLDEFRRRGVDIGVLIDTKTPHEAQQWLSEQEAEGNG